MVKITVRYCNQSIQVFYGITKEEAEQRKAEYEAKHPTLDPEWVQYGTD